MADWSVPEGWIVKKSKKYDWKTIVTVPGLEHDYTPGVGWTDTPFTAQMTLGEAPREPFVAGEPVKVPCFISEEVYEIMKGYYAERGETMPKEVRKMLKSEIAAEKRESEEAFLRAQAEAEEDGEGGVIENSVVLHVNVSEEFALDVEVSKSMNVEELWKTLCETYQIEGKKGKKLLTLLQTTQSGL
jgi:hypothetical protein